MVDENLEGTTIAAGDYTVADWKAHLWADATRNTENAFRYDEDAEAIGEPGQLVPPSVCQHIVFEATGGVDETMSYISDDWESGAALGGLRVDFKAPLVAGEPLEIEGHISEVQEKEGSSGPLTIVTLAYTARDHTGEHIFDLEMDEILMEGL